MYGFPVKTNGRRSSLLEVLFDQRCFFAEELHMLVGCLEETTKAFHGGFEGLGELPLFLIAPRCFEAAHFAVQAGEERLQFVVESIQILAKSAKLTGIHAGF
jgi:hypothetical protein